MWRGFPKNEKWPILRNPSHSQAIREKDILTLDKFLAENWVTIAARIPLNPSISIAPVLARARVCVATMLWCEAVVHGAAVVPLFCGAVDVEPRPAGVVAPVDNLCSNKDVRR